MSEQYSLVVPRRRSSSAVVSSRSAEHNREGERCMRSPTILLATALFTLSAVPSFGACTFPVTIGPAPATATPTPLGAFPGVRLSWPASGATNYEVQSVDGFHTTTLTTLSAGATGVTVNEVTT